MLSSSFLISCLVLSAFLATAPAPAAASQVDAMVSGAWVTGFVVAVLSAVFAGVKMALSRKMQMGPQPFEVAVQDKYVTRAEWLAGQTDIRSDVREMRVLYDKAITLINERDERISQQIQQLGEMLHNRINKGEADSSERRRDIYNKLNDHADLLSRIDARTDVSKSIGKLGAAIVSLAKKDIN